MITETEIQYKILQNSLSRFSIHLNKADSLADISKCLLQNAKYLYNYSFCRFHYFHQEKYVCCNINHRSADIQVSAKNHFCNKENTVFNSAIPYYKKSVASNIELEYENVCETWIWKFEYGENAGMLVTIVSEGKDRFLKEQISAVKIATEMLYTKIRMILLMDDLKQQQEALLCSYKKLEESNSIISTLLSKQEETIEERTQAVTRLNEKLVALIQFNSHNIREPLTRVMGLMNLHELTTTEEYFNQYWPLLKISVRDMDRTIRQIIFNTENIDKYENFFD